MTKKRSKRDRARRRRIRRDPFGRFALAVGDYLRTIGWSAVVVGPPAIVGEEAAGLSRYQLLVSFTGGRIRAERRHP